MEPIISRLSLPNKFSFLSPMLAYVYEIAKNMGFSNSEIAQINLGLEEAVTNVMTHGLEKDPHAGFEIECEQATTSLTIRILEKGVPFDPAAIPVYSPKDLQSGNTRGLGTFLIKRSMDEVAYHNLGRMGKETVLVKYLKSKRIDDVLKPDSLLPYQDKPPAHTEPEGPAGYEIRQLLPEEAVEVSQCAYRAYGYSYSFGDYVYYPDRIVALNQSGKLISIVAITADHEIMGHVALKFPDDDSRIAEIGVAFVKPKYRRFGLLSQIGMVTMKKAYEMNLDGVFSEATASHIFSQKSLSKTGFKDSGILLALSGSDIEYKEIAGKSDDKVSSVLYFMPIAKPRQRTIYPPKGRRELVEKVMAHLQLPYSVGESSDTSQTPQGETRISLTKTELTQNAKIRLFDYGADCFHELKSNLKKLCLEHTDVIFLHLDLENRFTASFADYAESIGFVFSGIFPYSMGRRHAMIYTYLNNFQLDFDKIALHSPMARQLLEHIRTQLQLQDD